jgi:hypothetical protein
MTGGGLFQDTTQMKLDVLSVIFFTAEATIKNCFVSEVSRLIMSAAMMTVK